MPSGVQGVEPDQIRDSLRSGTFKAVLITHNETSTGVTNPLEAICAVIKAESDALILVDAVSSLGCVPFLTDAWGVDIVVTGSQKGWEVPPGLGMVAVGPRAWAAAEQARMPRFYLDLKRHADSAKNGQTPWTPTIPILFGLDVAVQRMAAEGPDASLRPVTCGWAIVPALRCRRWGLELLADPRYASNTVTAVKVPESVDGRALTKLLREKYDTVLGGGQGKLTGKNLPHRAPGLGQR